MMSTETLTMIVSAIIVVCIIVFIAKRLIKVAVVLGIALLLFNIGFLLNGTEIREMFRLDNFLNDSDASFLESTFNDFDEKREEFEVIDPEIVYDGMTGTIDKGATILIQGLGHLDIGAFADSVAAKIVEIGKENIDMSALREEIKSQLGEIQDEQLDLIMAKIEERLDNAS